MMPAFSFVIPVFKTEQYLARCLDSLVAQTDGDFEAIIVDDGSPVGTAGEIVARYDARFKYIRQDRNRSTFQAKATGAKAAKGDYIVPLDSDDYVLPELVHHLHLQLKNPETKRPSPDLIIYQMAKEVGGKLYPVKYNHPAGHCSGKAALKKLFEGRIFMPVCGKAIRREVFLRAYEGLGVGPDFYLNFTDDLCWLVPILLNTRTVSFITYSGYRYWRHDDSMTKDVLDPSHLRRLAEQSRRSVETVADYAERLGADEPTSQAIRAQLYPTVRWLSRDKGAPRDLLAETFGEELVRKAEAWDAEQGCALVKLLRHLLKYGCGATVREVVGRVKGLEI